MHVLARKGTKYTVPKKQVRRQAYRTVIAMLVVFWGYERKAMLIVFGRTRLPNEGKPAFRIHVSGIFEQKAKTQQ